MTPVQQKNVLAARKIAQGRVARIIAGSPATPKLPGRQSGMEQITKTAGIPIAATRSPIPLA